MSALHKPEPSPWERGYADGLADKPGPAFPKPDTSWAQRLYAAGWSRGVDHREEKHAS